MVTVVVLAAVLAFMVVWGLIAEAVIQVQEARAAKRLAAAAAQLAKIKAAQQAARKEVAGLVW